MNRLLKALSGPAEGHRFRHMTDGAPVSLWMADASGHSTYHNKAWLAFTGRKRAEMGGRAWLESVHPDDLGDCLRMYREAFRARRDFQMEYRLRRHDGVYRHVTDMGAPYYGEGGIFRGFVGATIDVTEHKKAAALAAQFGRVLDSSLNEIYIFDAETLRFTQVNHGARRNLGYSMEELRGMAPYDIKPDFSAETFEALLGPLRSGTMAYLLLETVHQRKDGSRYPVEVRLQLSRTEKPPVFIAIVSDITGRRLAEEDLKGRNMVLEKLATGAPLPEVLALLAQTAERSRPGLLCSILLLDRETGRLRKGASPSLPEFYNDSIEGLKIGPAVGSCGTAAFTGELVVVEDIMTHPFWEAFRDDARRAGVRACWSQPIRSPTGEILGTFANYYREVRAPTADDLDFMTGMAHLAGIAIARKQSEDESAAARVQSEIANRTKTEFLANMSHELRSPLNSVLGFAEIMRDELFGPLGSPRYRGYAEDILQSANHLLAVINDILDISKIEARKLELDESDADIAAIVEVSARLMRPRLEQAGLRLEMNLGPRLPHLYVDPRKVKQILLNLISNAVKFTPAGGKVAVSARLADDGDFCLIVADSGIGIAPENIDKALSPFTQIDSSLSRKYEGTGLGLPLSKALAELHGGKLEIQSEVNAGTAVTVTFPANRVILGRAPGARSHVA